jgi:Lar family restriction alleviation protein
MTDAREIALLPCPFCGMGPEIKERGVYFIPVCNNCGAKGSRSVERRMAIRKWNHRSDAARTTANSAPEAAEASLKEIDSWASDAKPAESGAMRCLYEILKITRTALAGEPK